MSVKVVAIIGASANRVKFGNKAVRAFAAQGYTVIPINPHEREIEGLPVFRSVLDVPGPIDMASVYLAGAAADAVLPELAQKGIPEVWLNPGADDDEIIERARALNLKPIVACSIVGLGVSPYSL